MDRSFKIAWNANELATYSQEIKTFIFSRSIDISRFTNKSYYRIPGYHVVSYNARQSPPPRGTAIIIRSSIGHYKIGKYQREYLQATNVAVEDWNDYITITDIYSPSKHAI